ncbi:L-rhamnose isomerase [bacterium]|nr:L-rhamnose isomerase [bacterium]
MTKIPIVSPDQVAAAYAAAKSRYAAFGLDPDLAIKTALAVPIALHCWQADDVTGLEKHEESLAGGGIMAIGNYPGRPRTGDEIRADLARAIELIPGVSRINLHALYAEVEGGPRDRDRLEPGDFRRWIDWAKQLGIGLDMNPSYFAHPKANDGFTLAHADPKIRAFWIDHGIACRHIAEYIAKELGSPCVNNHWIPDGIKDYPADRWSPRERLVESLDAILAKKHGVDPAQCLDAVEGKLFGLGSEEYTVGAHEFYSLYALTRGIIPCLDMGHYHPTETITDKVSSLLAFHQMLLIHTSRGVRWDSDHVVIFNEDVRNLFLALVRGNALDRVAISLDFFDASINRVGAYIIGARATRKAILSALLDPSRQLRDYEQQGRTTQRLALMEEFRTMPFSAVWDQACQQAATPVASGWIPALEEYEQETLKERQGK